MRKTRIQKAEIRRRPVEVESQVGDVKVSGWGEFQVAFHLLLRKEKSIIYHSISEAEILRLSREDDER